MKNLLNIVILLLFIMLCACSPEYFVLNKFETNTLGVKKLNTIYDARKTGYNSFELNENGKVAIRSIELTEFIADFTIEITEGSNLKFYIRSSEYNLQNDTPIVLEITHDKIIFHSKISPPIEHTLQYKNKEAFRLQILNYASDIKIKIDCEELINVKTNSKNSEYVIIESSLNTKAKFYGISFNKIELY